MILRDLEVPGDVRGEDGNDPRGDLKLNHLKATDRDEILEMSTSTSLFANSSYDLRPAEVPYFQRDWK